MRCETRIIVNHTKEPKTKTSKPTRVSRVFMVFSCVVEHREECSPRNISGGAWPSFSPRPTPEGFGNQQLKHSKSALHLPDPMGVVLHAQESRPLQEPAPIEAVFLKHDSVPLQELLPIEPLLSRQLSLTPLLSVAPQEPGPTAPELSWQLASLLQEPRPIGPWLNSQAVPSSQEFVAILPELNRQAELSLQESPATLPLSL